MSQIEKYHICKIRKLHVGPTQFALTSSGLDSWAYVNMIIE
jgi:hypothetical protein